MSTAKVHSPIQLSLQPVAAPSTPYLKEEIAREIMSKCKGTMMELGRMLFRLEELVVIGCRMGGSKLSKVEEIEKSRIENEIDIKLKALLPVFHGFMEQSTEGNKRKQSIFKLARFMYKSNLESENKKLSPTSSPKQKSPPGVLNQKQDSESKKASFAPPTPPPATSTSTSSTKTGGGSPLV